MSDLKATFATLLDQTITAPRLSGSKVQTLITHSQTLTAQNSDTEVVTTFYRVNSGLLPASSARISSLYVFDAIARSARKDADKEKEKGKAREGRGMTGLITKMEGVVDAWVMGMVDDGKGGVWVEGKDKIRKILDIWRKGSTFPQATLDRLQSRLTASDAGPSRLATPLAGSNGYPGPSTTPPGTPPAPTFSPVLPPLNVSASGDPRLKSIALPPSANPPSDSAASQNLPPEILKLLGIQNATAQNPPPPQPTIDIATLLASVRPGPPSQTLQSQSSAAQTGIPGYAQQQPYPPAPGPSPALNGNGGPSFALDPRQLAALAQFAPALPHTQTPPHNTYPLPGNGNGGYPPGGQGPSYPPHDRPGYAPDPRGPPGRGNDSQQTYNRGSGGGNSYNDSGPISPEGRFNGGRNGFRGDDRGPPPNQGWDRRDEGRPFDRSGPSGGGDQGRGGDRRDGGRTFDRSGPPGGREQGWGEHRSSRDNNHGGRSERPRSRSRSPGRNGPPRDRSATGRGDGGYGGGDRGGRRGGGGGGGGHKRGRESHDYDNGRNGDVGGGDKPGVKPNYGGFKNQSGRFDPPPSASSAAPTHPPPNQQSQSSGRAPLPPGRDGGGSRAPLPPGRNMGDEPAPTTFAPDQAQRQQVQSNFGSAAPVHGPRLETFDLTTFNPMMPECWAALALAWKGTTGTEAGQMELMGFLAGQGPVMPTSGVGPGTGGFGNGNGGGGGGGGPGAGGYGGYN